jgi:hypothetical protein
MTLQPEFSETMPTEMIVEPGDFLWTSAEIRAKGGVITTMIPPWYSRGNNIPFERRGKYVIHINWRARDMMTYEEALATIDALKPMVDKPQNSINMKHEDILWRTT